MPPLRIGTRGSPLALIQTRYVIEALERFFPHLKEKIRIVPIKTTGDAIATRSLTDLGGKSLFTKEIEKALLDEEIDLAVHSMKDVTTEVPSGLVFPAMLEREDPRDAVITYKKVPLENLPPGTLFGTSSLRRRAYILHTYPFFSVTLLRGNVRTRLTKVEQGDIGATLLAVAGLKRLGFLEQVTKILSLEDFLPAIAQGAIGIQCRKKDTRILDLLAPLNHLPTFQAVTLERSFMKALHGSCRTPIAGYACFEKEELVFRGMISDPLGKDLHFISCQGPASEAEALGKEAGERLRAKQCAAFL